jgi:hypothetical protein
LIAAALQYGHVRSRVTLAYAGEADTSWLDDVLIERLEMVVDQTNNDLEHLHDGEHVSGRPPRSTGAGSRRSCRLLGA